ncbi:MAG: FAD-dependent oxidoreductase [Thermoproteales archaeon]|nr:FAD-dependent oxidoreductase [Thermoproteales archaeon]
MPKVVIIGYGSAGMTAAGYSRITDRKSQIIVFEKRPYAIYHPCSLPDVLSGYIKGWDAVKEDAPRVPNMKVLTSTLVEEIDPDNKKVIARNLKTGEKIIESYDKLILANGAKPAIPRVIKIEDSSNVFTFKVVEDGIEIEKAATKYKKGIIVGGSAIGIETAHALRIRGIDVTLIEYFPQLMPGKMDKDLADRVSNLLKEEGVNVVLGEGVTLIEGPEGKKLVHTNNSTFEAGFVVMATGVKPDTTLAEQVGLELGETRGIKVDESMRTSNPDIFAAGDNAEVTDIVTGRKTLSPFASTAIMMGRVAGINAVGGDESLEGVTNVWIINLGKLKFGAVGITENMAKKLGLNVFQVTVSTQEKLAIYPDASSITIRLLVHKASHRILGGQVIGDGDVAEKLNILSILIERKATVEELSRIETAYTPSICEVIHPLHTAADAAIRRLRRR